jgi:hypothetical protein
MGGGVGMDEMPLFASQQLEQVREGMTVLDASGAQLGKVVRVHMGDPEAVSTIAGVTARLTVGTPVWFDAELHDVPEPMRRHLLRTGFVEIDGPTMHGAERFIPGNWVSNVSGEMVVLEPRAS